MERDVTVVIAVYNTMPYLTECLTSLLGQSIGADRMEVVAVDDGSTDGSGKELDRFAQLHPDLVRVIHQPNSGGPAAPSNRALDVATGRYVFFLGSDDHLGPEALERLVAAADEHGTDVVVGRMVGLNGRWVPQAVFERTRHDATLRNSPLPWALSNTKLFRRALVERHGLRFPEDLPILSDQPFTLEACFRAERISILADYDYYFAVRRGDASNVTYRGSLEDRLRGTERIMRLTERHTDSLDARHGLNRRHLTTELAGVLGAGLLALDRDTQQRICEGAGRLVADYGTEALLGRIPLSDRVHLLLARAGALDELLAALRFEQRSGVLHEELPHTVVDGRFYPAYPFLGRPGLGIEDHHLDLTASVCRSLTGLRAALETTDGRPYLRITGRSPRAGYGALVTRARVRTERTPADPAPAAAPAPDPDPAADPETELRFEPAADGGTRLSVRVPLGELAREALAEPGRWLVRLHLDTTVGPREFTVPADPSARALTLWQGVRPYRIVPVRGPQGRQSLAAGPLDVGRIVAQRLRRLAAVPGRK